MILSKLQSLGRREKTALLLAVGVVVVLLLDLLVVQPFLARIRALDADIENAKQGLEYSRSVLELDDAIDREYQKARQMLGETATGAQDMEILTAQVDALANSTGMEVLSMAAAPPGSDEEDPFVEYAVEVRSLETDRASLLKFLHQCPQQKGLLRVRQLSVTPRASDGVLEGSMVITRVMLKPLTGTP